MASASKAGAPAPALDKQSLCLDILVSGHVQAYVDFFYLTHRPEVEQDAAAEAEEDQVGVPSNMLPHVKTQLEEAEVARRRGDTQAVFAAYRQLADFFTGLEDQRTAIYFWEKCLEITQLTSDVESEKQATRSLGMAHEASKDMTAAIKQYETLLDLTKATSDVGGAQQANEHLVVVYEATAASRDAAGDPHGALECREKCLEAARASGDPAKERKAHYDLGQAHEKLGGMDHLKKAIAHYESNLTLAQKADETEAQGAAAYALAQTYQRLQDGEKSLGYLKQFLRLAQASSSARAQAEA
jgi:tetratricopeptide (TPR) repeat protein